MDKIKNGVVDIIKSLVIGISLGCLIGLIFTLIGLISRKGVFLDALYVGRASLLIIGALGLLVCSMFFLKRNGITPLKNQIEWKKHFKILNYAYVLLIIFASIILVGGTLDYLVRS